MSNGADRDRIWFFQDGLSGADMFTGIIQEIGKVISAQNRDGNLVLTVSSSKLSGKLQIGSSIAINGACQTVTNIKKDSFTVEAISETLAKTNLGSLKAGSKLNLESSLTPQSLLDGHIVQGHVDCTGRIINISRHSGSVLFTIGYPPDFESYLVSKGSVAIDGISLTVVNSEKNRFTVAIIPLTLSSTILSEKNTGDVVNLEFDIIAKYIEKMTSPKKNDLTIDFLKEHGFS